VITLRFDQSAIQDFKHAVRQAFWRDLFSWLTRKSNNLLSFDQIRQGLPMKGYHYLGLQVIPLAKIVGSVQRSHDFDRAFLPRYPHLQKRWMSIYKAYYEQVTLPPVELVMLGEVYFVRDGHHRVSVARVWGQDFIDAIVIGADVPIPVERYKKCQSNLCGSEPCLVTRKEAL
jgi:hypothetical protein